MTKVKICGIASKGDAFAAVNCGADALGFIFYPPSPRYIKPDDAEKIIRVLPDKVVKVGVFVNEQPKNIKKLVETCGLDMIQLHGDESPDDCRLFPSQVLIKAVELKNEFDLTPACAYPVADILVDNRHAGRYGGTGKKSNWDLAAGLRGKIPLILSGGLNAENVADALKTVTPDALDINSGVEASPGKKDHQKLARIFDTIRAFDTKHENFQSIFKKRDT